MSELTAQTMTEILERIEATWEDWLSVLERVDLARRTEPGVCGYWSVKDLLAHIALCDSEIPEHIQRWQMGLPTAELDIDTINAENVAENHARSYALVRMNMHQAHQSAIAAIRAIDREPDDDLRSRIAGETWDHYPEHTDQIRTWLNQ
jgi:hypothetical protein